MLSWFEFVDRQSKIEAWTFCLKKHALYNHYHISTADTAAAAPANTSVNTNTITTNTTSCTSVYYFELGTLGRLSPMFPN